MNNDASDPVLVWAVGALVRHTARAVVYAGNLVCMLIITISAKADPPHDRDLVWNRRAAFALIALNLIACAFFLGRREWSNAIAGVLWSANVVLWLSVIRSQQKLRDYLRRGTRETR